MMNFKEYQPEEIFKRLGKPKKLTKEYFDSKIKDSSVGFLNCAIAYLYIDPSNDIGEIPETELKVVYCRVYKYEKVCDGRFEVEFALYNQEIENFTKSHINDFTKFSKCYFNESDIDIYIIEDPNIIFKLITNHPIFMTSNGELIQKFNNIPEIIKFNNV